MQFAPLEQIPETLQSMLLVSAHSIQSLQSTFCCRNRHPDRQSFSKLPGRVLFGVLNAHNVVGLERLGE
ncbi:MAG: hypothetical protein JWM11_2691 [Planctomycetaceae bacterium]|nr:hypothetical protein [Planctomycetaceae bacterium]